MTLGSGYLYLPDGWDTGWKTAKETSPNPRAVMLGDSISLGVGAAGGNPQCFTEQLYRQLVSQLGSQSDYFGAQMGYLGGDGGLPWSNQQNGSTLARFISNQGFVGFTFSNAIQLTAPGSAPTAAGSGTGGTLPAATYYYAVTNRNTTGQETTIGPASAGYAASGTTSSVALSAIPLGPAGTTSRRVYRSTDGVNYLLVNTIGDNTTTTWTDAGSAAGAAAPSTNGTAAASQSFTTPYPCTSLDIVYWDSYAGNGTTWGYQVDGGSVQTVTNLASGTIKKVSVTGLPLAVHTVSWGWQSANAACAIQGITTYRSPASSGLSFSRVHNSGANMNDLQAPGLWAGTSWTAPPVNPHLAILALSVNDINGAVTIANFTLRAHQMIRALRRANSTCSILILIPSYPDATTDDSNPSFGNQTVAYTYHVELLRLAQLYDCALVNLHAKWGPTPFGQGFLPNNDVHPTQAGQNDIYNTLANLI